MGLDILLATGPLTLVAEDHRDVSENQMDKVLESGGFHCYAAPGFAGREAPLIDGAVYAAFGGDHFRAGSYTGYGRWREALAQFAYGVDPETVWGNPDDFADKPFFEIIHFSDCEGTIGPEVAAKLARDFEEYRQQAREAWPPETVAGPDDWGDWRMQLYELFAGFFQRAANTKGAVIWA
jgi:hypothetical protein